MRTTLTIKLDLESYTVFTDGDKPALLTWMYDFYHFTDREGPNTWFGRGAVLAEEINRLRDGDPHGPVGVIIRQIARVLCSHPEPQSIGDHGYLSVCMRDAEAVMSYFENNGFVCSRAGSCWQAIYEIPLEVVPETEGDGGR